LADRGAEGDEREGERRGRKAFVGIRKYLEGVRIRDEALMGWVTEMIDEEVIESPP
jgi:chromatin structure-remodeling complex subunit RSC9